ncbi:putative glutaredoxin family protein/Thio-disulfide isomerase (plasmid) [Pseudorhizobium banfieldiae]|uniref:Putative glutaredoxin family protein/Thio-disulfide isomerase n=1 Tax=Pseudorhizobium banfieldiae TaxID=1125847 RepID=L0NMX3_9HYPH|nr:thioredoxin family protein [Pseudorhizobium banfieldiae]CAD6631300.1 thioredoxin family protein [arsenite-oxidising bacterium NT-25]CCF22136.1 putative glutaredoxin family protein/Thio-disulfide isomerase [Pseudorhizobium banfieldiae]HZG27926.1 thioredoxin family protein [Ensifer sp.]
MEIKVLGPGCAKCKATVDILEKVAKAKGANVTISKVEDIREIVSYGVMSTPGVVVDGKVVHYGSVPTGDKVEAWLK